MVVIYMSKVVTHLCLVLTYINGAVIYFFAWLWALSHTIQGLQFTSVVVTHSSRFVIYHSVILTHSAEGCDSPFRGCS